MSGAEVNERARRVESLASHDIAQSKPIDALIAGLHLLGLGELARDREWLLANVLLGGAADVVEQRSTDLVPAASVPPERRGDYRFALLRYDPFIVWVNRIDTKERRRSASGERQGPRPGLGNAEGESCAHARRTARDGKRCRERGELGGVVMPRCRRRGERTARARDERKARARG